MNKDIFEIVQWPDIQILMELPGFKENSYLCIDDSEYGSSAYFVRQCWFEKQFIIEGV